VRASGRALPNAFALRDPVAGSDMTSTLTVPARGRASYRSLVNPCARLAEAGTFEVTIARPERWGDARGIVVVHFDEAEALAPAGVTILDNLSATHGTEGSKQLLQIRVRNGVAQVTDIQFLTHVPTPQKTTKLATQ
jgi:hypothetical protein